MPRLPEYQEGWEPRDERVEVLDILANSFEPGERALLYEIIEVEIVRYYGDGDYEVKFPTGVMMNCWDGETTLFHHSHISRKSATGAKRNTR